MPTHKHYYSNRWFAVVHSKGQKFRSSKNVRRITFIVWTISALISLYRIPLMNDIVFYSNENSTGEIKTNSKNLSDFASSFLNHKNSTNLENFSKDHSIKSYEKCMFFYGKYGMTENTKNLVNLCIETLGPLIGFVIPILIITFCYASIVFTVRRKTMETSSRAPVGRVAKLSTLVIIAFIFCWTPQKVFNLWSAFCGWLNLCPFDEMAYHRFYPFCLVLAWTNSIMNPILYALTTPTVRKYLVEIFPCLKRRPKISLTRNFSMKSFRVTDSSHQHFSDPRQPICSCAKQESLQVVDGEKTLAESLVPTPESARNLHGTTKFTAVEENSA